MNSAGKPLSFFVFIALLMCCLRLKLYVVLDFVFALSVEPFPTFYSFK